MNIEGDYTPETIIDTFRETVSKYGSRTALSYKVNNKWEKINWNEYYNLSKSLSYGLIRLGLKETEGVSIFGFNSYEWFLCNMATIMAGGISVGIYTTSSSEICDYIINDSHSTIIFVENEQYFQTIMKIPESHRRHIKAIIQFKNSILSEDQQKGETCFYDWHSFMELSKIVSSKANSLLQPSLYLRPKHCASLIYTSGTTGNPKGVMLSHDNIIWTVKTVLKMMNIKSENPQRIVSYLPLSHVAGQMLDIYMPIINGGETWFADASALKGTLVDTLKEALPTIFLGVPRVWEKIMEKMLEKGRDFSKMKKYISTNAKEIGLQQYYRMEQGLKPSLKWKIYNKIIFSKVKKELGLSKCHLFLTGAAPISKEVLEYFASLNIPICDIFGMSETSACISLSYPSHIKLGKAGVKLDNTELRIDNITHEICTKGRHVMLGYLNQIEKTQEVIDINGWLHTGDIGYIDDQGYLQITGRIKELLITSGGENIPPVIIEENIKKELPIISNCMVIGDKRKFLTLLITLKCLVDENNIPTDNLDNSAINLLKETNNSSTTIKEIINNEFILEYISNGIKRANQNCISSAQRIQKFKILPVDFSIHGGELGPTLKLKRNIVIQKYSSLIEEMYSDNSLKFIS